MTVFGQTLLASRLDGEWVIRHVSRKLLYVKKPL